METIINSTQPNILEQLSIPFFTIYFWLTVRIVRYRVESLSTVRLIIYLKGSPNDFIVFYLIIIIKNLPPSVLPIVELFNLVSLETRVTKGD